MHAEKMAQATGTIQIKEHVDAVVFMREYG
jgi:hypothetical protein